MTMDDNFQFQIERFYQFFNHHPDIVCISDYDTGEILFANRNFIDLIGKDPIGDKCYHSLFGFEDSGSYSNVELSESDDIPAYSHERECLFLDKYFLITDQISDWFDGRKVRFEIAKDITGFKNKEMECKTSNIELEKRNNELNELNQRLSIELSEILSLKDKIQENNRVLKETNLLLSERENMYKQITENISDVVWTTDLNFHTTFVSTSVTKLLGESVEYHLQRTVEEKFSAESRQILFSAMVEEMESENNPDSDPKRSRTFELEHYKADGTTCSVEMRVSFIRDASGKPIGFQGITRDIGERKKIEIAQKKLLKQHQVLSDLRRELFSIESSSQVFEILARKISELLEPAFVFICSYRENQQSLQYNTSAGILSLADELFKTVGIKYQDFNICLTDLNINVISLIKGNHIEMVQDAGLIVGRYGQNTDQNTHSYFFYTGGINLKNQFYGSIFIISHEDISEQINLIDDIIQRGLLQLQNLYDHYSLRLSEEKFSKTFKSSPDVILISTVKEGKIIDVNDSITRLTGYKKEELMGKPSSDFNLWKDKHDRGKYIKMIAEKGKVLDFEALFIKKNGDSFYGLISGELIQIQNDEFILSIIHDISDRKLIEMDLFESKSRLERTFENIPDVIVLYDTDLRIKYINAATRKITGYPESFFIGKRDDELWDTAVSSGITALLMKTLNLKVNQSITDYFELPRGRFYLNITCVPLLDDHNNVFEIIGITHDLTRSLELVKKINESEEKFRNFFEYNQAVMLEIDIFSRKVINCNKKSLEYYGYSKEDFLNKTVYDLNPSEKNQLDSLINHAALKSNSKIITKHKMADGRTRDVEILISTFDVGNEKHNFIIVNDITEQKNNEFELEKYRKNLEETVKARTQELEEKNTELEKFNELFVGREFRIKELKNKISELENVIHGFNERKG